MESQAYDTGTRTARPYVGRLAPSPTGALHLGNIRTFLVAWLRARALGGRVILRIEDLDHPKVKRETIGELQRDLQWLGFDWDEVHQQTDRLDIYRDMIASLKDLTAPDETADAASAPLIYPCICTRRDVQRVQSAPHAGEQMRYPGTCRGRFATFDEAERAIAAEVSADPNASPREPSWRFRVPAGTRVVFEDVFAGRQEMDVAATLGDFPLARGASGIGYTLAATLDDILMGVTEIVRGDDLLPATPAQILLARRIHEVMGCPLAAEAVPFSYLHVPLVVGPDGRRLAKRHGDTRIASFREAGWTAERLLGFLAASCGWCREGESLALRDLLPRFTLETLPKTPFVVPASILSP